MTDDDRQGLPEGWIARPLESIASISGGGTPLRSNSEYWNGDVAWLSSGDIKSHRISEGSEFITAAGLKSSAAKMCDAGSIVIVTRSGVLKHSLPVALLAKPAAINQDLRSIETGLASLNEWIALALRSHARDILGQNREGTTVQSVKTETLRGFRVPLPPLAEQRRIVAKAEALLARVQAVRQRLERVPRLVNNLRRSYLASVFGGETSGWRTMDASGACEVVQSGTTPKEKNFDGEDGIPFLKVYNIVTQSVDFEYRPQFISRSTHESTSRRARVLPGDVLMNIVGPPLGKVAIVPDTFSEWSINQAIAAFRPKSFLSRRFLYYQLCSGIPYWNVLNETRGSAGQANISLSQCRQMPIAIPSLDEQDAIVRRIDTFFVLASAIERRVADATKRAEKLTQAILAKAFRGELVPTDAELARAEGRNYESAERLLDRVRTEQGAAPSPRKRTKRAASKKA